MRRLFRIKYQTPWQSKVICRSGTMPLNLIVAATSPDSGEEAVVEACGAFGLLMKSLIIKARFN